jgi:hypothetical protein
MRRTLLVFLTLAACGKTNSLSDAPRGDGGGADASTTDADLHGTITVIVNDTNAPKVPLAGVPVVFVNPDGKAAGEAITDASGIATGTILPGASVTVVYGGTTLTPLLETVRAVAPGDTIVVGPLNAAGGVATGTFTASLPDYPGSISYDVYGPCGPTSGTAAGSGVLTPITLSMSSSCQEPSMDLLAIAHNSDKIADAWLEQAAVPYTDGGSTTMPDAWQAFQAVTLTYSNVAASGVSVIYASDTVPDSQGYQVAGYASLGTEPSTESFNLPGTATALVVTDFTHATGGGQQQLYDVVDGTKAAYTVDLSTALLPFIAFPSLDSASGAVNVTGATAGDVLDVSVQYSRVIGGNTMSFTWEVWTPPTESFTLPTLPTDLVANYPAAGDTTTGQNATLYGADAITDWSQIRGKLFGGFDAYITGRAGLGRLIESYPTGVGFAPRAHASGGPGGRHQRAPRIRR